LHHLYGRHWVKIFSNEQEMRAQNAANGGLDSPKLVWRPGSARTRWRSLQRSPDSLAGFRGESGMGGRGREGGESRDGEERGGMGKGGPATFWLLRPPMAEVNARGQISCRHIQTDK